MIQTKTKRRVLPLREELAGGTLGIYYGNDSLEELRQIRNEAEAVHMQPSEYVRRLIRIGRKVVEKDPIQLLKG
jgi:hypothetical protein